MKIGSSSSKGSITTPALGIAGTVDLSFVANNYSKTNSTLSLTITNGGYLSASSVEMNENAYTYNVRINNCISVNSKKNPILIRSAAMRLSLNSRIGIYAAFTSIQLDICHKRPHKHLG